MKVKNVSGERLGVVPANDGPHFIADMDEIVEVRDSVGARLLEQPRNWAPAGGVPDEATVGEIKAWVGDSAGRARRALDDERSRGDKARSSLIDALTKITESEED